MPHPISAARYVFRREVRAEASEIFGEGVALSVLAVADQNRDFRVYSPIAMTEGGQMICAGPYIRVFDDMLEAA